MWISKKKWQDLEKRVADLEVQVQGQRKMKIDMESVTGRIQESLLKQISELHD